MLANDELLDELSERGQLFSVNETELIYEVYEMLEASVQVSLCGEEHDMLKMRVIYVRIDAEKSLEDDLDDV